MTVRRTLLALVVGVSLATAMASSASALEPGKYFLGPCDAESGATYRPGWEFDGNNHWSLSTNDCEAWLQQAPVEANGFEGPATATLMLGPGTVDELRITLGGSDGLDRFITQQVSVCGPGGWPSDCGDPVSVPGVSQPGGDDFLLESGDDELPVNADRVVMSAICLVAQCATGSPLKVLGLTALMTDATPPSSIVHSTDDWMRSDSTIPVSAEDLESGIDYVRFSRMSGVKFSPVCGDVVGDQPNADNAWPCPLGVSYLDVPLPLGLLSQGPNSLNVEVRNGADLGSPKIVSLRYDSTPPGAPTSINYGQSERGWAIGKSLTLRWTNSGEDKETSTQSGVARAKLVIDPQNAGDEAKTVSATGDGVSALPFTLSGFGVHEAHLTLTDAAGNARVKDFEIRNDEPSVATPSANSIAPVNSAAASTGVKFTWNASEPLSKLCGFRVELNSEPDTDLGGIDPNRPTTTTTKSWTLTPSALSQLSDGQRYLHVQSVACSDAVSSTNHFPVLVDRSAPKVEVVPVPTKGWLTNDGSVTLRTTDPGSTRQPTLRYWVGNVQRFSNLKDTEVVIPPSGARLAWSAVDYAGNESLEESITVGVDSAAPVASIERPRDDDPAAVSASVVDAVSGVVSAQLEIVNLSSQSGRQLARFDSAAGTAGPVTLSGRIPDDGSLPNGAYLLQVTARDAADHATTQTLFVDGSAAALSLPLRPTPTLTAGTSKRVGGPAPAQRTLEFGARSWLVGSLRDPQGAAVVGAGLSAVAEYEGGGLRLLGATTTRGDGSYELALGPDTSRKIVVRFAGNTRYGAGAAIAVQDFRAGVTLAAKRVSGGVRLVGKVRKLTASFPRRGLKVELELCPGGSCKAFGGSVRADSDGGFSKFWPTSRLPRRSTYQFRARVDQVPGWPFADGVSRTVKFHGGTE